jgi:hypothetical protein
MDSDIKVVIKRFKVPLLGSDHWYIQENIDSYVNSSPIGITARKETFGPYSLRIFYCSVEADYHLLGQHNETTDTEYYSDKHYSQLFPASFFTVEVLETDFAGQDSRII